MTLRALALVPICALALAAQALPLVPEDTAPARGPWKVDLGAMLLAMPAAPGARETRVLPLPVFSAEYMNRYYLGSSRIGVGLGGGVHAFRDEHFLWDLGLGAGEARRESRADELAGMGDRSASLFGGTALRYHAGIMHGGLSVAVGLREGAGVRGTLSLGVGGRLGGRWSGGLTGYATVVNAAANSYDFGVDPGQAADRAALIAAGDPRLRTGEAREWAPAGGLQELALGAVLGYRLDARWRWFALAREARLQGDAKDSPLVRKPDELTCGLGFAYRF